MEDMQDIEKAIVEQKEWSARYKMLEPLCYTDGELLIRPVASREELAKESKALNHCAICYEDLVKSGRMHILFIRKASDPETPYFTLSISFRYGDGLVTYRGYNNEPPTIKIKEFVAKWFAEKVIPQ